MNYYKLKYSNGDIKIVKAKDSLTIIKRYDLTSVENIDTHIAQLEGEQLAIAISNDQA